MKILLIQPPARDFYESSERLAPVGLASIKACLSEKLPGCTVKIMDARAGHTRRTIPLPPELSFLRGYYTHKDSGPFGSFSEYYHFGANYKYVASAALEWQPNLVGISCLFSAYYAEVLDTASAVKKALPGVPIVLGGPHASASPESVLKCEAVDFVIRGEGERPFVELARAISAGCNDFAKIPNLVWREGEALKRNAIEENYPYVEMPFPDYSDLDADNYTIGRRKLATIVTSRGCPHSCDFCSAREIFGVRHRQRTVDSILAEMRLRRSQGCEAFDFEDDNLTLSRSAFFKLLDSISSEFGDNPAHMSAMNGINYQTLDRETLALMRRAGFRHLNISLVSSDDGVCSRHGRRGSAAKFASVSREAAELDFLVTAYLILGLPDEPLDSMLDGLALLAGLPVLIGVSPFYLTPGMELWSGEPTRENLMRARLTALGRDENDCSRSDVYTLFISARILNFLKGLNMNKNLPLRDALEIAMKSDARNKAGAELLSELLDKGVLRAWRGKPMEPLDKFDTDLFMRLWNRTGRVETRKGCSILLA